MKRGPTLKTSSDVAYFLAKVTREAYMGTMEMTKAKGLAYISGVLLKSLEVSDLEGRISALEESVEGTR